MKRLFVAGFVLALFIPACALAQSTFDGSWKLDPSTLRVSGGEPVVTSLKNGVYECTGCGPAAILVRADGKDHKATGNPDYDTIAIDIINDHSLRETDRQNGKVVSTSTTTVATDGKTSTIEFTDDSGLKSRSGTFVDARVGNIVPGESALTGAWKFDHYDSLHDPSATLVLSVVGSRIMARDASGAFSYSAEIGGNAAPFTHNGKPVGTVSVKRLGKASLRMTFEMDGKVIRTKTITITANGKAMKMTAHDSRTGATVTMIHDKV